MDLKPLSNSETAWCWYAMDFSDGHEATGSLEHLAVRFKGKETADNFKAKFEECQRNIGEAVSSTAAATTIKVVKEETTVAEESEDRDEDYEEYEDEEDYDENGETIIFISQGEVDLKIVYDDDVFGARILAEVPT